MEFDIRECHYIIMHNIAEMEKVVTSQPKPARKELQLYELDFPVEHDLENTVRDKNFDQFSELKKKINYTSTYNESIYTTELNINSLSKEQLEKAQKLSEEIEKGKAKENDDENEERNFSEVIRQEVKTTNTLKEPKSSEIKTEKPDDLDLKKMIESVICKDINLTTGTINQPIEETKVIDDCKFDAQEIKLFREKRDNSPNNPKFKKRHSLEQTIGNLNIEVPKIGKDMMQKYMRFKADKNTLPDKASFIKFSQNYKISEHMKCKAKSPSPPKQSTDSIKSNINESIKTTEKKEEHREIDTKKEEKAKESKIEETPDNIASVKLPKEAQKKGSELRIDAKPYVPNPSMAMPVVQSTLMPVNIVYYDPTQVQPQMYNYNYGYPYNYQGYQYQGYGSYYGQDGKQ